MADFSQPGGDGVLPSGFKEWQRGVTYTVRPEIFAPLRPGQEYQMIFAVRRIVDKDVEFPDFGSLYKRVVALAEARVAEFREPLHSWVMCHAWTYREIGARKLVIATLTLGLVCAKNGEPKPQPMRAPSSAELMAPGGASLEELERINTQPKHEVYVEFDHCDAGSPGPDIVMFSYGEYVPSSQGIDFEPIVQRAGDRACAHYVRSEIIRREWFSVTHPDMAVVHVYLSCSIPSSAIHAI